MANPVPFTASLRRVDPVECDLETIRDSVDLWLREPYQAREQQTKHNGLGFVCRLFERGECVAIGRGTTSDSALEQALEEVGALA